MLLPAPAAPAGAAGVRAALLVAAAAAPTKHVGSRRAPERPRRSSSSSGPAARDAGPQPPHGGRAKDHPGRHGPPEEGRGEGAIRAQVRTGASLSRPPGPAAAEVFSPAPGAARPGRERGVGRPGAGRGARRRASVGHGGRDPRERPGTGQGSAPASVALRGAAPAPHAPAPAGTGAQHGRAGAVLTRRVPSGGRGWVGAAIGAAGGGGPAASGPVPGARRAPRWRRRPCRPERHRRGLGSGRLAGWVCHSRHLPPTTCLPPAPAPLLFPSVSPGAGESGTPSACPARA